MLSIVQSSPPRRMNIVCSVMNEIDFRNEGYSARSGCILLSRREGGNGGGMWRRGNMDGKIGRGNLMLRDGVLFGLGILLLSGIHDYELEGLLEGI